MDNNDFDEYDESDFDVEMALEELAREVEGLKVTTQCDTRRRRFENSNARTNSPSASTSRRLVSSRRCARVLAFRAPPPRRARAARRR